MTPHDFIFTKKLPGRYLRHLAFWIAQYIFWIFWVTVFYSEGAIVWLMKWNGFFVLEIIYTYLIVYFVSPDYLASKRYFKLGSSVFILTLFTYFIYILYRFWFGDLFKLPRDEQILSTWFYSMNFIIMGPPVFCTMFLTFKMLKHYYIKIEERTTLAKENANAELQLLKAQIHPHFLFNTLNNIYSFTLNKSTQAGSLVKKLSDTLKYMINECEATLVPLEKEIKMLQDYIGLEKVRYGNRLGIEMFILGNFENKLITPLILIPFVENCFKHGTSKMLEQPWIKLEMTIVDQWLLFQLHNSKPKEQNVSSQNSGIGLKNVKKRLELIYPSNHEIKLSSDDTSFSVFLKIPLQEYELSGASINATKNFSTNKSFSHV